jgi:hypothetical protein
LRTDGQSTPNRTYWLSLTQELVLSDVNHSA